MQRRIIINFHWPDHRSPDPSNPDQGTVAGSLSTRLGLLLTEGEIVVFPASYAPDEDISLLWKYCSASIFDRDSKALIGAAANGYLTSTTQWF